MSKNDYIQNQLYSLLKYYSDHYVDQWDKFQINTSFGPVYVVIHRSVPDDEREDYQYVQSSDMA